VNRVDLIPSCAWRSMAKKGYYSKKGKREGNNIFSSTGLSIYHGHETRTRLRAVALQRAGTDTFFVLRLTIKIFTLCPMFIRRSLLTSVALA
jgi:hypothetical protein